MNNYEINTATLLIKEENKKTSLVSEIDNDYYVQKQTIDIIDESCKFFGSSYKGRVEGTKNMVKFNYKVPIIVEESKNLIFFPITSPRYNNTTWISLNNIEDYYKKDNKTIIIFKGGKEVILDISFYSLENQIFRSTMLLNIFQKRKIKNS